MNLLIIDQGTTSTRAMIFNQAMQPISVAQKELPQSFPKPGWVEHDPEVIWQDVLATAQQAIVDAGISVSSLKGMGITNQRETTLIWDKKTSQPIYPAIVWQDRRTAKDCKALVEQGLSLDIQTKTGLLIDPYFSATKIAWLLDHIPGARERAEQGELLFGTIETFLLWRLTGGVHATDASNAARTLLYNIQQQCWDETLLQLFNIPPALLPKVLDNSHAFGHALAQHLGASIPVLAMAGDQQAASFGQACLTPGMVKSTYGTGCFVLMNTGETLMPSKNRLISTVAYRLNARVNYALEGSIFVAGATVQWLRDALQLIKHAKDTESIATQIDSTQGVYLVPAFTGLGAPYWDPQARGAILGLTRDSGVTHIVRAALESVCYQTRDLLDAMQSDAQTTITCLRVDGGMVSNDWLMQFLADILQIPIERPTITETTALGVAYMAALQLDWLKPGDISQTWQCEKTFTPNMPADQSEQYYQGWREAVARIRG